MKKSLISLKKLPGQVHKHFTIVYGQFKNKFNNNSKYTEK